jgi:acetyl esterase/lipase
MNVQTHAYATPGGQVLRGDLYSPQGDGPHAVLVAVPGGAWRAGSRTALAHWGANLSRHGYAVFAIDHRRSRDGVCFPHAVQDVRSALRFIAGHARELRLDAGCIGMLGASAGAHLASLATLSGAEFDVPGEAPAPDVKILALAYGVYDLTAHWQENRAANAPGPDVTEAFLGCAPYDDPLLYQRASPIRHVRYANSRIPVFLTWGTEDDAVLPSQSLAFQLALRQAGFFVRACPIMGAGHYWFSDDPIDDPRGFTGFVAPRLVRFLQQHFRDSRVVEGIGSCRPK